MPQTTSAPRRLLIVADDFGIGPQTSAGILELAKQGRLSATVLLVNSPHAAMAVRQWENLGCPLALGWHPNLTLDSPILRPKDVPSLCDNAGRFRPLCSFLSRLLLGRLNPSEIFAELEAQLDRFLQMVGQPPSLVNTHQHVGVFEPVASVLLDLLGSRGLTPYLRRVCEPWSTLWHIPGARMKRVYLNMHGRKAARRQEERGFPGNDWLAGIANSECVPRDDFFASWLGNMPGDFVELMCHPGLHDDSLIGRDGTPRDAERRVDEMKVLQRSTFWCRAAEAGFHLATPRDWLREADSHAA